MIEFIVVCTLLLWAAFAAIFPLAQWAEKRSKWVQYLVWPLVIAFLVADVLFNAIIGTIVFLELPDEWTFSERIDRLRSRPRNPLPGRWYGWRWHLAGVFERIILSVDPEHF